MRWPTRKPGREGNGRPTPRAGATRVARGSPRNFLATAADLLNDPRVIVAIGNDLVEVQRVRDALERLGERFERRIYTIEESRYCRKRYNYAESFAARFAAKEAVMKALGTGWRRGVRWVDIEVRRAPGKAPEIHLHGATAEHAKRLGIRRFLLTLTHTATLAEAIVLAESE